jgi:kanosamine-6-phosphate phosphatase
MQNYPYPNKIDTVICSDLDETFLPFSDSNKKNSGIPLLESFLLENIQNKNLIFGWITGSNLDSALSKTSDYISYLPHFIACSLGTEFYWVEDGLLNEPELWIKQIIESGYRKENVDLILEILRYNDIDLILQSDDYQSKYKSSFYYTIRESYRDDFSFIESVALNYNCKVLFSRANPAAGDPENSFDVEFIPKCCGKGEVVEFLKKILSLNSENFYAFGDSFNDFSMFSKVSNSFLVGNADPLAKVQFPNTLSENYCIGITKKLKEKL